MMSYAPSYFPGVAELSQALRVTVKSGEELRNANFSLTRKDPTRNSHDAIGFGRSSDVSN
jgi:hypothetical protein